MSAEQHPSTTPCQPGFDRPWSAHKGPGARKGPITIEMKRSTHLRQVIFGSTVGCISQSIPEGHLSGGIGEIAAWPGREYEFAAQWAKPACIDQHGSSGLLTDHGSRRSLKSVYSTIRCRRLLHIDGQTETNFKICKFIKYKHLRRSRQDFPGKANSCSQDHRYP